MEAGAQVLEPAAHHGDLVEHDRAEDDPHDREEAEHGALGGAEQGEVGGHPEGQHRDEDGDGQRREPGPVRLPAQGAERDEDREQGSIATREDSTSELPTGSMSGRKTVGM
ncbi:hypothetical protein GCM10025872_11140 [Barrientosiimonas endolithica]|uniref:Uncharacterized protein n=1 Tax=Barrientosiimonas endolithica TaxID=1535208 RepID=A0ABM8H957_9MICO|nr:hypothetical protein GCM10025872_11140 [Barrientosiimonas endolithica]